MANDENNLDYEAALAATLTERAKQLNQELDALSNRMELLGEKGISLQEKSLELDAARIAGLNEQVDMLLAGDDAIEASIKRLKRKQQFSKNMSADDQLALDEQIKSQEMMLGMDEKKRVNTAKGISQLAEAKKLDGERKVANEQIGEAVAGTLGAITGVSDAWKSTLVGGLAAAAMKSKDLSGALTAVGQKLSEQFSPANLLGSTYMKVTEIMAAWIALTVDFAFKQDEMISKVRQAAVGSKEFDDVVVGAQLNVRTLGVGTEELGAAFASLHSNMAEFTNMTTEAQGELLEFTALMSEMGVSSDVTAANLQTLTRGLGFSAEQAVSANRELAGAAVAIGMPIQEMMQGFQQASPILSKYGKDAPAIFKKVAAASKATGISIQGLLSITEKFDTFEGAAEAAGSLNALLGGTVNSLDLLNASEEERIGILIRSVEASGKNWASMHKFERQAIANAAGITDMAEANQIFGQSSSEYDAMLAKVESVSLSQEDLEEATRSQMSVSKKWGTLLDSFAVSMRPLMEGLSQFLDYVLKLRKEFEGGFNVAMYVTLGIVVAIAVAVGALVAVFIVYKVVLALATMWQTIAAFASAGMAAAMTAAGVAAPAAKVGVKALAGSAKELGQAAVESGGLIHLFVIALIAMAGAVIALVAAIPLMVYAIKELIPLMYELPTLAVMITIALIPLSIGLALFSIVLAAIAPIVQIAAVAMMQLGVGMVFLGAGMFGLALGIKILMGEADKLPKLIDVFASLGFELVALLAVGIVLAPGLILLGYALLPLGIGIASLGIGLSLLRKNTGTLSKFADAIFDVIFKLGALLVIGVIMAPAMFVLGYALLPLGLAMAFLGIGLLSMGFGLKKIKKEANGLIELALGLSILVLALGPLGAIAGGGLFIIGLAFGAMGIGLLLLAAGIKNLGKALKKLDAGAITMLGSFLGTLAYELAKLANPLSIAGAYTLALVGTSGLPDMMEAAVKLTPEKVKLVGQVIQSAEKYAKIQKDMKSPEDDSFAVLLKELTSLLKGGDKKGKSSGKQTIVLKIGERAFAKAVVNALEEENALSIG